MGQWEPIRRPAWGAARLNITDGGLWFMPTARLSRFSMAATAVSTVDGADSQLIDSGELNLGWRGTLNITAGGFVSSAGSSYGLQLRGYRHGHRDRHRTRFGRSPASCKWA